MPFHNKLSIFIVLFLFLFVVTNGFAKENQGENIEIQQQHTVDEHIKAGPEQTETEIERTIQLENIAGELRQLKKVRGRLIYLQNIKIELEYLKKERRRRVTLQKQPEIVTEPENKQEPHCYAKIDDSETIPEKNKTSQKVIYLTFDDGPLLGTQNILTVLEEEEIKATMFFVGKHIKRNKPLFNKASKVENVLLCNHTYSHANGHYARFYNNRKSLIEDIDKAQEIIEGSKYLRLAGRNTWRLPEVSRNDPAIKAKRKAIEEPKYDALSDKGYFIYGWDIEWAFSHKTGRPIHSAKAMAKKINTCYRCSKTAREGKIILLAHDFMFQNKFGGKKKLRMLIELLRNSGWHFDTLENYSDRKPERYVKKINPEEQKKIVLIQKINVDDDTSAEDKNHI